MFSLDLVRLADQGLVLRNELFRSFDKGVYIFFLKLYVESHETSFRQIYVILKHVVVEERL